MVLGLGGRDRATAFAVVVRRYELGEGDVGWTADRAGTGRREDSEVAAPCSAVARCKVLIAVHVV